MRTEKPLTRSSQDYLEAILNLSEREQNVRITDLANHLQVTKPSATGMVKAMSRQGLLQHDKYGPIQLTEEGAKQAHLVRQRHRALKDFLVHLLGVPHKTAEKEACLMEHSISMDTSERLYLFLQENLTK